MLFIEQLPQQIVNGLWLGGVYALFALGYTLVFGVMKELNLAHGSIFMWGAFMGLLSVNTLGAPLVLALPLAMLGAGLLGVLLERLAYKPLRELSPGTAIAWMGFILFLIAGFGLFPAWFNLILLVLGPFVLISGIVTDFMGIFKAVPRHSDSLAPLIGSIGAASIMGALSQKIFGAQQSRFPQEVFSQKIFNLGMVTISQIQIALLIFSLIMLATLNWLVFRTRLGRALRAVACNQRVAALLGIHVDGIYMITFFLSGALAGAAGVLHGLAFNAVTPYMGAPVQLKGLTVIVLGGMGSISGAVLGGFAVALLEVFSVAAGQSNFRDAIVFLLMFVILLVRPNGFLGVRNADKV